MVMVNFNGMDPWPQDSELVECVIAGEVLDLHNDCVLTGIEVLCKPMVELVLRFVRDEDRRPISLGFTGVADLRFSQDEQDGKSAYASLWDPGDTATFYSAAYHVNELGVGVFQIATITGELSFTSSEVTLDIDPS